MIGPNSPSSSHWASIPPIKTSMTSIEIFFGDINVGSIPSHINAIYRTKTEYYESIRSLLVSILKRQPGGTDYNKLVFKYKNRDFFYQNVRAHLKGNGPKRISSLRELIRGCIVQDMSKTSLKRYFGFN
jgi:hypothetical protein